MARFTTTAIAAVIFCLFTLSLARTQPNSNDVTTSVSLPLSEDNETESNPLTIVMPLIPFRFNQINRRFRVRSKYPCRHRHQLKSERISYGNDMLVASGENSDFENPIIVPGGKRQWARIHHHHHDMDSDSDSEDEKEDGKMKRHGYHEQEKRLDLDAWKPMKPLTLRKHFHHPHHEEEKKGDFMKRVRDFVDNYL